MEGMKSEGVIATVKHFPGHGDVEIDSHKGLPILPFDKERLYNMELKPFIDAINNGVQNIMAAHIVFQEVDEENPATVSKDILKGILRDELKYTGLITSDCMEMKAISETITTPGGVLKGIQAGDDLVLVSHTKQLQIDSINLLKLSIGDKSLSIEEVDEKVKRILKYKNEVYSVMNKKFFNNPDNLEIFNDESQGEILQNIVDSSLTFVNGKKLELKGKTLIYWSQQFASTIAEDILNGDNMGDLLNKEIPSADTLEYIANQYSKKLVKEAKIYDTVVFISFNAFSYKNQTKMINEINDICSNFYVISIRNPYDYLYLNQSINYYTLYESTPNSMRTVVKFLKGKIDATGKLPVTLSFN
jgi:beta-N-acetylhexosaminidase